MPKRFTIHYACASLIPQRTSYVTVIGVCDTETKKAVTFSMEDAQKNLGTQSSSQELEAALLKEFFAFVSDHPGALWIHWHMHSVEYGFEVLKERYEMLWHAPAPEFTSTINLPDKIFGTMQRHCRIYPKMYRFFERNGVNDQAILSGEEEAENFEKANFAPIKYSVRAKAEALATIYDKLQEKTLETLCRRSDKKVWAAGLLIFFAAAAYLAVRGV
ncbi:MAG: hypothetical protein JW682_03195 [Campylobacterales bacterium]|nr:hypothetical protein [Campylobacterales bacterium]HEO98128.1 hypothetical protein [Campylobacterota bacterium]